MAIDGSAVFNHLKVMLMIFFSISSPIAALGMVADAP
jgi:hypothetical protein